MRRRPDHRRCLRTLRHWGAGWLHPLATVAIILSWRPLARADDLSEFEHARSLYESMQYGGAVEAFMALVGTDPPRLRDALLVIESRKYLAASLVFEDRIDEARAQFQALLRAEPDYTIDPLAFPDEVVNLFDEVRRDMAAEIHAREQAEARARAEAEAKRQAAERERKARLRVLRDMARREKVEVRHSRLLAAVPFGVGQIQNGHKGLGRFFAVSEALLMAGSIATFVAHDTLRRGAPAPADVAAARRDERTLRIANYTTFSGFLALVVAGIIDAQVRFEPRRSEERERELPEDLDRWIEAELAGAGVRLRF